MNVKITRITRNEALKMLANRQKAYYLLYPDKLVDLDKVMDGRLAVIDAVKPDGKKTRKKRKSHVDAGKINALHEAGWNAAKIAEEMDVAVSTVYRYIRNLK